MVDSSYLRYPKHQTVQILPEEWQAKVLDAADFAEGLRSTKERDEDKYDWNYHTGFTDIEISKIRRIVDWMRSPVDEKILLGQRQNFYRYITAHDERRGTNFKETFPELADFYDFCGTLIK